MIVKPRFCPFMKGDNNTNQCGSMVTLYAFNAVCNHPNFGACKRYAEIMKQLKTPIQWLQSKAVEMSGKLIERQDER